MRRDGGERLRRCACATYLPGALGVCAYLPGVCAYAPTYLPTYLPGYLGTKKPRRVPGLVCALCVRLTLQAIVNREAILPEGEGQQVESLTARTAAGDGGGAIVPSVSGGG